MSYYTYYTWNWSKSLCGCGGGVGCKPILVFSFGQAEQFLHLCHKSLYLTNSQKVSRISGHFLDIFSVCLDLSRILDNVQNSGLSKDSDGMIMFFPSFKFNIVNVDLFIVQMYKCRRLSNKHSLSVNHINCPVQWVI